MYLTRWLFRRTRSFTSSQLIVVLRACLEKNLSYYCHLRKNSITIPFFYKQHFFYHDQNYVFLTLQKPLGQMCRSAAVGK